MTNEEINKACDIVRDLANEHFGDWEQSCKFEDNFRKALETCKIDKNLQGFDADYLQSKIDAHTKYMQEHGIDSGQQLAYLDEMRGRTANPWHKVSEELPPTDTEVVCKIKGAPYAEHFVCKWDGEYWWRWNDYGRNIEGWFGLEYEWKVTEWREI